MNQEYWNIGENRGNLTVLLTESNGRQGMAVYGDPKGLRFLAAVLERVAALNQQEIEDENLPPQEGFHLHVTPPHHLNQGSVHLVIGRLDSKADGSFSWFYPPIDRKK